MQNLSIRNLFTCQGLIGLLKKPGLFNANPKQILVDTSVEIDKLNIYKKMQKA